MRDIKKIQKMLGAMFNIFAVTKLTEEELDAYLKHIKHLEEIDHVTYGIEYKKAEIAKRAMGLIQQIQFITTRRLQREKKLDKR